MEEFFKKSIENLLNRLQLINLPLMESITLIHTLKKYTSTDLLQEFNSMERHPVPLGRDPCIWFSTGKQLRKKFDLSYFSCILLNRDSY